jgi:hypothetical protein
MAPLIQRPLHYALQLCLQTSIYSTRSLQSAVRRATYLLLASRCLCCPIAQPPRRAQPPSLNVERVHDRVSLVARPAPTPLE